MEQELIDISTMPFVVVKKLCENRCTSTSRAERSKLQIIHTQEINGKIFVLKGIKYGI